MRKIKIGVVGTGHLGSIHARIYKEDPDCSLCAICDTDQAQLDKLCPSLGVPGYRDYRELFDKVEAVSIATPTRLHSSQPGRSR